MRLKLTAGMMEPGGDVIDSPRRMDGERFDHWSRTIGAKTARRTLIAGTIAAAVGGSAPRHGAAKPRCKKSGKECKNKRKGRQAKYCAAGLEAPFVIQANWTNPSSDHDTFLFVPNSQGSSEPMPFIDMDCASGFSDDGTVYPFAFASGDATGPGNEVTTVKKLLNGRYEYHLQLDSQTPAGDVTVRLMKKGRVLQAWSNPASALELHWRVFSLTVQNGRGTLQTIDDVVTQPSPITYRCN